MDRTAVFVDAGYLFAQASVLIAGRRLPRQFISLDATLVVDQLKAYAARVAPSCSLLRIYWYDASIGGGRPTTEQSAIAFLDDVKLRLGMVNAIGEQKGVDSLIVTDLIELARLKSIQEAVLLAGDEDLRIGVQIAQSYGVRVHLLGIQPSRGSQSPQLVQEADTTAEWDAGIVGRFITIRPDAPATTAAVERPMPATAAVSDGPAEPALTQAVATFATELEQADLDGLRAYWTTQRGLPADLDRRLLNVCRRQLSRGLDPNETKLMRRLFREAVAGRSR